MSILAVAARADRLTLAVGTPHAFHSSEIPTASCTPLQLFEHILQEVRGRFPVQPSLKAAALGSDLPSLRSCLTDLAQLFRSEFGLPAVVISDEHTDLFLEETRLTGCSRFARAFTGPKLTIRYAAELAAAELGIPLVTSRFVIVSVGEAVTVAAVQGGKILDLSSPYDEGPFSVTTSGTLPFYQLLTFCAAVVSREEAMREVTQRSGFKGYLGVESLAEAEALAWHRHDADLIYSAFVYQIAKEIGAYGAVLKGRHSGVVLTGPLLPVNGLRGLSAYLGDVPLLSFPGDFTVQAVLSLGQEFSTSGKGLEADGFC